MGVTYLVERGTRPGLNAAQAWSAGALIMYTSTWPRPWPRKGVGPAGPAAILVDLPISLALSAATACSWAEQAFAAGGDNGNESFESRFLCNGTTLCYTIDLWRTDIYL